MLSGTPTYNGFYFDLTSGDIISSVKDNGGKSMIQKGYLTVREASSQTGLSKNQITHLLRHGILQGSRIERVWLIGEDSLKAYLANRPKPGPKRLSKKGVKKA